MSASQLKSQISSERQATVARGCENWISKLIDLSRRNRLLYFRELKTGTLNLTDADADAISEFLRGESVPLTRLLPNADETVTLVRAQEIRRVALANREEKGLDTLFVVFGFATWPVADNGRAPESPVLLMPVGLEKRGRDGRTIALKLAGEYQINPVLLFVLEDEHGLKITSESILQLDERVDGEEALDPRVVYKKVSRAAARVKEFRISPRVMLGNFSFHKMAMVKDLRENPEALANHDLIASLAGDPEAKNNLRQRQQEVNPRELDQVPPENEFLVLDADSSQQAAISAVLSNQSGVILGPPGTGKSQTIANLIAELAARGRRVLFVAEKRVALEVVINRLREVGLGHLALDLHGAGISRREVMRQFSESLALVRESLPVDASFAHQLFVDRRKRLNQHVHRLHVRRPPSGLNVFELQGRLLRFKSVELSTVRWRGADLERLGQEVAQEIRDLLIELTGFKELFLGDDPSPWTGSHLADGQSAQRALDAARRLARDTWPSLQRSAAAVVAETGLRAPTTIDELKSLLGLLHGVNTTLETFAPEIFHHDLDLLSSRLKPSQNRFQSALAWCFRRDYRAARKTVHRLHRGHKRTTASLLKEVAIAAAQLKRWKVVSSTNSHPAESANAGECRRLLDAALIDIGDLTSILRTDLTGLNFDQLTKALSELAADPGTPPKLPRLLEIERRIVELGAGTILKEIRQRRPESALWPDLFDHAWLSSCLDRARAEDAGLGGFNGRIHEQFAEKFCALDRERMRLATGRVRRAHAERSIGAMNANVAQEDVVRREANKRARHMPLRKLLAAAPDVLTALRPCWLASPLSVSELIPVGNGTRPSCCLEATRCGVRREHGNQPQVRSRASCSTKAARA